MYKILLIEDDTSIRETIKHSLLVEGYFISEAENGQVALDLFRAQEFDLILLDMMLPHVSGEEVLMEVRRDSEVPILVISAINDELSQVEAFTHKVDDYVVKPFSMNILIHKIKAVLRRVYGDGAKVVGYQNVMLYVNNYKVDYKGEDVVLTAKEFEILQIMILNQGRVYSRDELLTLVWGYDFYGDSRNVDVHIKNIRRKLDASLITTVTGVGYRVDKL